MTRHGNYFFVMALFGISIISLAFADNAKKVEGDEEAIFTLKGQKLTDSNAPQGRREIYHWPVPLTGLPYISADFTDFPDGDICVARAFYWGRVIGSDGLNLEIRWFTKEAEDNQMSRPFVKSEDERKTLTDRLKRCQQIYTKYGCSKNTLSFYMDKPRENEDINEFKVNTYKYTRQRAELAKAAGIPRMMIDMEWSNLEELKKKIGPREACQYAWEIGREVMRAIKDSYLEVEFGYYPCNTTVQYNIEKRISPKDLRFQTRTAFIQGFYDNRDNIKIFHFCGWTYNATDQCTGTMWWTIKQPPYTHSTYDAVDRIIYGHRWMIGDDIKYEWGRWELGGHRYVQPGLSSSLAMIKLANVPPEALERTWLKLYESSNVVWVWDHFNSWDEDGGSYVTINNDVEMKEFDKWLAEVDPAYHKLYDANTGKYWIPGTPGSGFHGTKRDLFKFHTKDGITHITGKLDPNFVTYVNLTKELAGRDRDLIPLYSQQDIELAKKYKEQGYFPYQELKIESKQDGIIGYLAPAAKSTSVLGRKFEKN